LVRRVARGLGDDADLRDQRRRKSSPFCRVRFFQLKRTREGPKKGDGTKASFGTAFLMGKPTPE
jgi:hypothetical protein